MINLGFLTQADDGYVWCPDVNNIDLFKKQNSAVEDLFLLERKEPVIYPRIPYHYFDFVQSCEREDLAILAGIKESDNTFEKLYKLAKLDFSNQDFYIKS